ncbi:hypothetical protein GBAR_LOCUS28879 [Geodia barretti]|uniref:Death domain-containing protein n=1 Tax=Geodia barretti TaxID=519541 RepID=A0AA35TQV2_GEOBA|nr:hypothetical protein GBAR_LOCUS28879 [Geodia barretti]
MSDPKLIRELVEELHAMKPKWRTIGTQLEICQSKLDCISQKYKDDSEQAFTEMMNEWLTQIGNEKSLWSVIVKVLLSRSVGARTLALNLARRKSVPITDMPSSDDDPEASMELEMLEDYNAKKVPAEVQKEMKRMAKLFNSLRIKTFRFIDELQKAQKVSLDDFRVFVCNPAHMIVHYDHHEIRHSNSTMDICAIISQNKYLHWLHDDLLEEIIEEYGDSDLKGQLESFSQGNRAV